MEDYNLAVLVDAKNEYTNQLINLCKDRVYSCIRELFENSKKECEVLGESDRTLSLFQKKLAEIPLWTSETLQREYEQVIITSNCEWLHELLTAVFMSHIRILSSIHLTNQKPSISLDVPSFPSFLHKCYIDTARCLWKSPYLLDDTVTSYDFQRNRRDCELIIEKAISESIRKQLPVKHILKNYLGANFKESTDIKVERESCNDERDNLYNMVKRDLEQVNTIACTEDKVVEERIKKGDESRNVLHDSNLNLEPTTDENIRVDIKEKERSEELSDFPILSKPIDLELPLDIELDGLTDITESLLDHGTVYGLIDDEEPVIKRVVDKELNELIENQEKDIKKLNIKDDLGDIENVTVKKMGNKEYNFFSDALPNFLE